MTQTRPNPVAPSGAQEGSPPGQTMVGDYRLMALIGEGGMGVVHLAMAPDGARVALKVLRPHVIGDAEARQRLAREVGSLRRVRSNRVAEVLDADPFGPMPYVATRYVPGLSLHEHVQEEGPVTGADLHHLADCLAEALQAVHAVGVLHRDVKPSNVLMEGRSPVLIDFGLARLAEDPRLTHTGWLLGTPGYLAPEILYGEEATPAADVHAWAATVAFAARGLSPYGRGPAMAVMDRVRRAEHDLSRVPEPLAALLADALHPEPLRRPSLAEVRRRLAGEPPRESQPAASSWTMPVHALDRPAPAPAPGPDSIRPTAVDRPATRMLPRDPLPAGVVPVEPNGSRALRRAQVASLGGVVAAAIAFAPYAALVLVAVAVLGLRATSVGRERLSRRRVVRGRRRWFDAPVTALASPGYLLLASLGSLLLVCWSAAAAAAAGVVTAVVGPPLWAGMLVVGVVFGLCLWWGPGALRLREVVSGTAARAARHELAGQFVVAACILAIAVLVAALLATGPTWSPATGSPWDHGLLAGVARLMGH